jgi:hypothetical protein
MKNLKKLLIITILSFNMSAYADVFEDVGNFIADNKTATAFVSIAALAAIGASMKPIGMLLAEDAAATDLMVADRIVRTEELAADRFVSLAERQNALASAAETEGSLVLAETEEGVGLVNRTPRAPRMPPVSNVPLSEELLNAMSNDGSFNYGSIR